MPRSIRDIAILLILIGGGLIILFSSPKENESGPASRVVYTVIRPFQQAISTVRGKAVYLWSTYIDLVDVKSENEKLKGEVTKLRQDTIALVEKELENRRLRKLLLLKTRSEFPTLVAQIIADDAVGWYKTIIINKGTEDGLAPDMPVVVPEGVLGKVAKTASEVSRVTLLSDPNLSLDCRILRTRDRAVLNGALKKGCLLRYISLNSDIKPGDQVITSGLDGVFPKGLTVGTVESVRKGVDGLFLEAQVKPAANFGEVEEVLVILEQKGGFDVSPGLEDKR